LPESSSESDEDDDDDDDEEEELLDGEFDEKPEPSAPAKFESQ
jgi:hypothetical protein